LLVVLNHPFSKLCISRK